MGPQAIEALLSAFVRLMREKLAHAHAVAKAAEARAEAGDPQQAVTIMLDVEQPLYEVNTLLNSASLINRIGKES